MLHTTARVLRITASAVDRFGGGTKTWTPVMNGIAYDLQPLDAKERNLYGRETEQVTHKGYTDVAGVRHGDRIECKGKTLTVQGASDTVSVGRLYVHLLLETN